MNAAVLRPVADSPATLHTITIGMLDEVLAIERAAYEFPWSRGNFVDSMAAGYFMQALLADADGEMRAYFVAMPGVEEMHLLNLTVAPAWQRRGIATALLDELVRQCRERRARQLWLEVRMSNAGARQLYQRYGFRHIGMRKAYYPAAGGQREDALVMGLKNRWPGLSGRSPCSDEMGIRLWFHSRIPCGVGLTRPLRPPSGRGRRRWRGARSSFAGADIERRSRCGGWRRRPLPSSRARARSASNRWIGPNFALPSRPAPPAACAKAAATPCSASATRRRTG